MLKIAHETLTEGHVSKRQTIDRVLSEYYWPGVLSEVSRYCRSCDICKRTLSKVIVPKRAVNRIPVMATIVEEVDQKVINADLDKVDVEKPLRCRVRKDQ